MTSFFRSCPANLTFLALQCLMFNQRSTHGSQASQITPSSNKRPLTRSKGLLENFSLKLLCDVIFRRYPANLAFFALQCPIFNQRSTHGSQTSQITPNSNKKPLTRSKDLLENLSLKLLCNLIFLLLPGQ